MTNFLLGGLGLSLIIRLSLFIFIAFQSGQLFAKTSCSEINLYNDVNNPLREMPVCDQGPLGVCYATTAAQMINYQLLGKKGQSVSVHPLWVAYVYKLGKKKFSSGLADKSADAVRRHGVCPAPVVEKSIKDFVGSTWMSGYQLFCIMEKYREFWTSESQAEEAYKKAHQNCMGWSYFNQSTYDDINELIRDSYGNLSRPEPSKMARKVMATCFEPGVIQKPSISRIEDKCTHCTDDEIKDEVAKTLRKKKVVGIDYCAEVLTNNKYDGIGNGRNSSFQWTPRSSKINDDKTCGHHSSMVVGQKVINNKCHYLLRNSWGTRKYSQWPNCVCEEFNGNYVDCQYGQAPYKSVSCWVGADELTKNTYRLVTE